ILKQMEKTQTPVNNENAVNYLKNILESRNNGGLSNKEVKQTITHGSYNELGSTIYFILEAIEIIAVEGNGNNQGVIAGLAELGKKLMPEDEFELLDSLLLEKK
ncbi:MAG: hypothetical protein ACM31G_11600, partial [Flavobacteriales bacterium]